MTHLRRTLLAVLATLLVLGTIGVAPAVALDRTMRLQALRSVVQLGPVIELETDEGTELRTMGWGSGTIITPDGLILTNYHVVDTSDMDLPRNATAMEDVVSVYITTRSDRAPTLSYLAQVVAASPELDLAVVRIAVDVSGEEVDWDETELPYLPIGDSDLLEPGDPIYIFGYPGIGGETVTFTSGVVSGFTSELDLGDRAWIKTDAAISGGNSGGSAINDDGELIGVPTQVGRGGVGGTPDYVDCRPLADTNGNGELDERDACVPVGGFINALRPVALAVPLIEEAIEGPSPYEPEPEPKPDTPRKPRGRRPRGGVQVTGYILDADTYDPIPGAVFVVLQPGVTYAAWESDDEIYTAAEADRDGYFVLPDTLEYGESYTLVAGMQGYYPVYEDYVYIGENTEPIVEMTVTLQER